MEFYFSFDADFLFASTIDRLSMIRVTIEMIPGGIGAPHHMGTIEIANDATGTSEKGNYKVRLAPFGKPAGSWMRGVVKNFCRKTRGPYDLLL